MPLHFCMQPLFPEDPASLDPRLITGSFAQRRRMSPRAKSMVLSPQKTATTKSTARRSVSLLLTKSNELADPQAPTNSSSGLPAAKHHRRKVGVPLGMCWQLGCHTPSTHVHWCSCMQFSETVRPVRMYKWSCGEYSPLPVVCA